VEAKRLSIVEVNGGYLTLVVAVVSDVDGDVSLTVTDVIVVDSRSRMSDSHTGVHNDN